MSHYLLHTARICLLLWLAWTVASCTDTADLPAEGRTATLELRIPQLEASATRATIADSDLENAIYTLRVIILSQSAGVKSINKLFTDEDLKDGNAVITIDQVPVGLVQLYVIANEASIGKNYTELSALQKDVEQDTKKLLIMDSGRTYFPKRGSVFEKESQGDNPLGLPMGWMNKSLVINEGTNTVQVDLERQVAKLNIEMFNTLDEPITVQTITFGEFFSDRFYFFREQNLDVPEDADYAGKQFDTIGPTDNGIEIKADATETMVCYIYPSFAWKSIQDTSPYTIGFTTSNNTYNPMKFVNDYGALNSIARNTQLNIHATLSKNAKISISFEVVDWVGETVDVPTFN